MGADEAYTRTGNGRVGTMRKSQEAQMRVLVATRLLRGSRAIVLEAVKVGSPYAAHPLCAQLKGR